MDSKAQYTRQEALTLHYIKSYSEWPEVTYSRPYPAKKIKLPEDHIQKKINKAYINGMLKPGNLI